MRQRYQNARAFTLVELMVVIGIIALLVALLLPALSGARRAAQLVGCQAQIQQALLVMQNHAISHHGYAPLVGNLSTPSIYPSGLNDDDKVKYEYIHITIAPYGAVDLLMCFTASLANDLGDPRMLRATTVDDLNVDQSDPNGFLKHFWCPSHMTAPGILFGPCLYYGSINNPTNAGALAWLESQSYTYNEAALGWDDSKGRARGQLARIRAPGQTMVMADGLGGTPSRMAYGFATLYNKVPAGPVTMADALAGNSKAGEPQNFDLVRHRGRTNIGFFDGHVESRKISAGDLSNIYLMAP